MRFPGYVQMIRFICLLASLFLARQSMAQFYYQDLISTKLTNAKQKLLETDGVKRVVIRSLNPGGEPNASFRCEENIDKYYRKTTASTKSMETGVSNLTSLFDDSGRIISSEDSSSSSLNITTYKYDERGNLIQVTVRSSAGSLEDTTAFSESHLYYYDGTGVVDSMVRKKNGRYYSRVRFVKDSSGNITSEQEFIDGHNLPPFYYKYSPAGNLTDIVKFNPAAGKMLATRMFDYNHYGQQTDMTTVLSDTKGYTLWKNYYNEKGLLTREECFQNGADLLGIISYLYEFR